MIATTRAAAEGPRDRWPAWLRRAALPVAFAAAALTALLGSSWVTSAPPELRVSTIAMSAAYLVTGYVARRRLTSRRIGSLFLIASLAFLLSVFQGSDLPPYQGSDLAILLGLGFFAQLMGTSLQVFLLLTFPEGKLRSRQQGAAIIVVLGLIAFAYATFIALFDAEQAGLSEAANPFHLPATAPIAGALAGLATLALGTAFVAIAVLLVGRWLRSSRPARRTLTPVVVAGCLSSGIGVTAMLIGSSLSRDAAVALITGQTVAYAAVPFGFLLGLLRLRMARGTVADVFVELGDAPAPKRLSEALGGALRDPTLQVVLWSPEHETYVDANAVPIDLDSVDGGRAVTRLERDGRPMAAVLHDPALAEDPGLVAAIGAALRLAVDNERLAAEVRSQLEEVRASRARIVEASDAERRRVERNLHDGAQQRLVVLSLALRRAQAQLPSDAGPELSRTLADATEQLKSALAELRQLARGIHPAILVEAGLLAALKSLARESPVPVSLQVDLPGRLPEPVEAAVYFVVSEGLANVAKYAGADQVEVSVGIAGEQLRVQIADDGRGGADPKSGSGLRGLADRVAALGGRLDVRSPSMAGTQVIATLPVASSPDY
jgi:signal transduction histidine kinase